MVDCSKEMAGYHDSEVTLTQAQRKDMQVRRDSNRDRLLARLKEKGDPALDHFKKQGSYAMFTMVQDINNDYDIDDGIYYQQGNLVRADGTVMTPKEVRQLICDRLQDDRFNRKPENRKSCARVYYEAGYHVDMPVYRITGEGENDFELASGDEWVVSLARDVEEWFADTNKAKSPTDDPQLFRRMVRLLKKFARSRQAWKLEVAPGFTVTKLAEETFAYTAGAGDDVQVRNAMSAIHTRLLTNLQVDHPVTPNSKLTTGPADPGTTFLREKISWALGELSALDKSDCTKEQALKIWNKVFNTTYFTDSHEKNGGRAEASGTLAANLLSSIANPRPVSKEGGGTYA